MGEKRHRYTVKGTKDMEYSQPSAIHTLSDVSKPDHIQERDTAAVETAQN